MTRLRTARQKHRRYLAEIKLKSSGNSTIPNQYLLSTNSNHYAHVHNMLNRWRPREREGDPCVLNTLNKFAENYRDRYKFHLLAIFSVAVPLELIQLLPTIMDYVQGFVRPSFSLLTVQ